MSSSEICGNVCESLWSDLDTTNMSSGSIVSNSSPVIPFPIHPLVYPSLYPNQFAYHFPMSPLVVPNSMLSSYVPGFSHSHPTIPCLCLPITP